MAEYSLELSALAGWLPLFLVDNVDDAILERVWWTGFLEGNRWPIKPIPQASSAPLTKNEGKMRLWTTLIKSDCAFYHKIIQIISRKSKIMLVVLFGIKRKKKCSRSQIMPKKSASTIGKSLQPTGIWLLSVPVGGKFEPCLGGVGWGVWTGNVKSFRRYTPVLGV